MSGKNDYGASHWGSDRVWARRKKGDSNLRKLNKIQSEILIEFLDSHGVEIQKSPYKVALERIKVQLQEANWLELKETEGKQQLIFRGEVPFTLTVMGSNRANSYPCKAVTAASTTTTPEIPKVNLWRLSEFSIRILELLRDCGSATNRDLCNRLGKNNNYVKQYLYRLRDRGIIFRNNENWKWYLHSLDADFFFLI